MANQPERILITGGAGFIGSHLTERLLDLGHRVRVVDNLSTGKRGNLPDDRRLEFVEGDVAVESTAIDAVEGCSAVFHLAAVASVQASIEDPVRTNRANLVATIRLLEACRTKGVDRFTLASSAAVYGDASELPVAEEAPVAPLSPYAADKLAAEQYLAHFHRQGWLQGVAFRFFNVYGPRQDPSSPYSGVISIFARRALRGQGVTVFGDGRQSRDFVFVGDVVNILAASLSWPPEGQLPVYNLGRGESVSLLDLLAALEQVTGTRIERSFAPARPGDIKHSLAAIDRLTARCEPRFTDLRTGLRQTVGEAA